MSKGPNLATRTMWIIGSILFTIMYASCLLTYTKWVKSQPRMEISNEP